MIERLQNFYRAAGGLGKETMTPIWSGIMDKFWLRTDAILRTGSYSAAKILLDHLFEIDGAYGVENRKVITREEPKYLEFITKLAKHIGAMPYDNPENNGHLIAGPRDAAGLTKKVEEELGFEFSMPDHLGYKAKDGVPSRLFHYCAAAWSIREMFAVPKSVLEIGPGFGNLGIILHRWHTRRYTVIDLPLPAVLCAYAMSKAIGEDNIWLWGEPENQSAYARIYPSTHFEELHDTFFLAFNSDSFPEIPSEMQQKYLSLMSKQCQWFMSINHESDKDGQVSVAASVKAHDCFRRRSRHPFLIRDGYVEELYGT